MENKIVTAVFKESKNTKVSDVWQWDYGQILRIQGLNLPTAVEVDFAVAGASESIARIGTTKDGVTDVVIPDSLIETGNNLVAYIYLRDSESGNTEYQIDMLVTKRAKPEAYDTPEDKELFGQAIEAVNAAADRAEKAGQTAQEAATKAGQDAEQTAQDRAEVAKMVETVTDISEQVKKVEDLSNKAQAAATKTEADAQQTAEDRAEVGKILENVKDISEQVKSVDESVRKAKESEQAAARHRTAVEEIKNSVEQTASAFPQTVQEGVQAVENAGASESQEITQVGTAQKTAVESAGAKAVENVENVKASATEAVETAKTEAVQVAQAEGTKQTGSVAVEGAKQVKAVQDKGTEVLQSIPEDFQTQMETKLNKQQGIENKGKALVIGEDGNVVPGEVQSGGGDGIAIINTMSSVSPLVIPDSAERVNKGISIIGGTEQAQTTGKNLIDYRNTVVGLLNFTDGSFSGTYHKYLTTDYIEIESGDYIISHNSMVGIQSYALYDINNKTYVSGKAGNNKVNIVEKCFIRISFSTKPETDVSANPIDYAKKCDIQLEKGALVTPYEPYTGGKPSPSTEYLQEIKNSGKWNEDARKYEVGAKITGKNLFDAIKARSLDNWIASNTHPGYSNFPIFVGKNKKVTFSYNENINSKYGFYLGINYNKDNKVNKWLYNNGGSSSTNKATVTSTEDYIYLSCNTSSIETFIGTFITFQIEIKSDSTSFQSYKEQTLTLTSDRPITKWDKLVEQDGQIGWLYGGKIIDSYNSELIDTEYMSSTGSLTVGATVLYKLKEPEFIPLPEFEQNAIRTLTTYYPTTVITVDGGEVIPTVEVTYTADTKNYIDGKLSAKVASVLRQYQAETVNLLSLMPMETQAAMIENDTNNILENVEEMKHE